MQLTFNIYGLIIGLAIVFSSMLIEEQLKHEKKLYNIFHKISLISFIFAIFGARVWHVVTDFYLYEHNLYAVLEIWNGGLSIFGGVLGGIIGLIIATHFLQELRDEALNNKNKIVKKLLDYSIFGLPFGQAVGRLGNYFNQELYGAPSNGLLKIFIDKEFRLPGFEQVEYYHPLFFYEMLATGLFAASLYIFKNKMPQKIPKIGSGYLFLNYILYYSIIRFFLDFLRLDKSISYFFSLGMNQVFLASLIMGIFTYYYIIKKHHD
jgi:phosphatidylglycerol:prolipoprotein diacylglycerol transferase